ncbi:hypothetical protein FQZ97_963540 [compost metagenome]
MKRLIATQHPERKFTSERVRSIYDLLILRGKSSKRGLYILVIEFAILTRTFRAPLATGHYLRYGCCCLFLVQRVVINRRLLCHPPGFFLRFLVTSGGSGNRHTNQLRSHGNDMLMRFAWEQFVSHQLQQSFVGTCR